MGIFVRQKMGGMEDLGTIHPSFIKEAEAELFQDNCYSCLGKPLLSCLQKRHLLFSFKQTYQFFTFLAPKVCEACKNKNEDDNDIMETLCKNDFGK